MPRGFHLLLSAQFASALADNAVLIVAVAWLHAQQMPGWMAPLLKFCFTIAYVVFAPFVGPLADAVAKARLMAWMNALKVLGVAALLFGLHPLAAFAVVGLGAAAYAPAKYGLITELVPARQLVAANAWVEVSVVFAVLFGTVLGGLLVSPAWAGTAAALHTEQWLAAAGLPASHGLGLSVLAVLALYAVAAALNRGVPDSGMRWPQGRHHPVAMVREFARANGALWRDRLGGGLSLAVTTLFWGVGAALQFVVLRWAMQRHGLGLDQAAYLQAVVAVGVVAGAALAGRFVPLAAAPRVLPAGVVLGALVALAAGIGPLWAAVPLLVAVGAVGGLLVVPMNAMLQHRGLQLLTAGRSIAVQGFNENTSVLAVLAIYAALLALDVPVEAVMAGLGAAMALCTLVLLRRRPAAMHVAR